MQTSMAISLSYDYSQFHAAGFNIHLLRWVDLLSCASLR